MIPDLTWVIGWTLIHFLWQGALAALLIAAALRAVGDCSANVRYVVACAGLLIMVSAASATAAWTWSEMDDSAIAEVLVEARPSTARMALPQGNDARIASAAGALPVPAAPWASAPPIVPELVLPAIVMVWLVGVAILLGRLAGGLWQIRSVRRASQDLPASSRQATCERLMNQLRLRSAVRVVESASVDVPTVIGWMRPLILLPAAALANLTPGQVEAILAHELAHVRRHDYLVNLLQTLAETLLFFHPAVWWVSTRIRNEREHCCDAVAVAACGDAFGYARALAQLEAGRLDDSLLSLAATGGSLLDRIRRILREPQHEQPRLAGWAICVVLTMCAAAVLVAATQQPQPPVASDPARPAIVPEQPAAPAGVSRVPVPPVPPAPPVPPLPATVERRVVDATSSWRDGLRRIEAQLKGGVQFTDDLTDVLSLSPGGTLTIRDWHYLIPYTVEIREQDGTIEHRYYVAGLERTWGAEARAALAELLPRLVRRTGFGARSRVARLLEAGGVPGVLDEIGRLETDHARRLYIMQLIDQSQPDLPTLGRIIEFAGGAMSSSYELSTTLRAIAPRAAPDQAAGRVYVAAADRIRSDYERRRTLTALVLDPAFDRPLAAPALQSALKIRSDYEKGIVVRELVSAARADPAVATAYVQAASAIRSDYERRRALTALTEGGPVEPSLGIEIANAARGIRSDYEKATTLGALAPSMAVDESAAHAYADAAATIRSDHERRRALEALTTSDGAVDAVPSIVAGAASGIDSDYQLAEVLRAAMAASPDETAPGPALLWAARGISSDAECARLLVQFVGSKGLDGDAAPEFFTTLRTIASSSARRRVLDAIIARDDIPAAVMPALFEAIGATRSDAARSALLVALVERHALEAADRDAFLRTASAIGSTREQNRVLTAYVRADLR